MMFRMVGRRARFAVPAVGLLLTATGAVAVASQPDGAETQLQGGETQFLDAVREYDGWVGRIPDATLIAEGHHACQWLARQPPGSGPAADRYEVFSRFIEGADPTSGWKYGSGRGLRGSVTYDAWNYLCPDVFASRTWESENPEDD